MSHNKKKFSRKPRFESLERRELMTTFFVDGANGNDSNDGLGLGSAFATIQAAANVAFPGDIVEIRGGTGTDEIIYHESVNVLRSGTAADPVIFRAYNDENVVISGSNGFLSGWVNEGGNLWSNSSTTNANGAREANTIFANGVLEHEATQFAENNLLDINDWGQLPQFGSIATGGTTLTAPDLVGFGDDIWNGATIRFHLNDFLIADREILDYDSSSGTVTFAEPLPVGVLRQTSGFYIFDTFEAIDDPGEWFRDDNTGVLYYQAEPGQDPNNHDPNDPNSLAIEFKENAFGFDISSRDYIEIRGLEFRGVSIDTNSGSSFNTIADNEFYGFDRDNYGRLFINGSDNIFRDNIVRDTFLSLITFNGPRHQFVNNLVQNVGLGSGTTRAVIAANAQELLFSRNTIQNFARSLFDGYPLQSEISFNVIEGGGQLSWDTGVFDSDGTNGNSSNSVFNNNIIRNINTRGIYEAFYNLNNNAVFLRNVVYDFSGDNRPVFTRQGLEFSQAWHNTFITDVAGAPLGAIDAQEAIELSYNNNIQITTDEIEALGVDLRGNFDFSPSDFVDFNNNDFRLAPTSSAIDTGIIIPGVNEDFLGSAPDPGAFEFGAPIFEAGHDFANPPTPTFNFPSFPGLNIFDNGLFEQGISDWIINSGSPNSADRNSFNLAASGSGLTGSFRTESVEFAPGDAISRLFTGLEPNTTYTLGVEARIVEEVIPGGTLFNSTTGNVTTGLHRGVNYVTDVSPGEFVEYVIDFGDPGQFDLFDIIHIQDPSDGFANDNINGVGIEVRLDDPITGQLLADFDEITAGTGRDVWRSTRGSFGTVSGTRSVYITTTGANGGNLALGSIRLLKDTPPTRDQLTVNVTSPGSEAVTGRVGSEDWRRVGFTELTFTTGPNATSATIQLANNGRISAYVDRLYVIEGFDTRGAAPRELASSATAELSLSPTTTAPAPNVLDSSLNNLTVTGDHPNSFIQVDLGEVQNIHSIRLSPANANEDLLSNFRVSLWTADPSAGGVEVWNQDYFTDGTALNPGETLFIHSDTQGLDDPPVDRDSPGPRLLDASGRIVRVQLLGENNAGNNQLALGEIQVFGFDENDLAISDGIATQSSTLAGLAATNANDGDPTTRTSTLATDTNSWWQVAFPQAFSIGQIELVNQDGPDFADLSNFTVSVWDDDPDAGGTQLWEQSFFSGSGSVGQGESLIIDGGDISADGFTRLTTTHRARVVRVQLNGTNNQGNGRLSLQDVRITSAADAPPAENIARFGVAEQSSDFRGSSAIPDLIGGFADNAINGQVLPLTDFTATENESQAYWQVDLQRTGQIDQIVLFNRSENVANRLTNFTVSVWDDDPNNGGTQLWDNTFFFSNGAPFYSTGNTIRAGGALLINGDRLDGGNRLDSFQDARFVRVQLNGSNFLELAEVQVWSNDAPLGINETVNLSATQFDYDFGSPVSPVEAGSTRITPITTGDIVWNAPVSARDAGTVSGVSAGDQDVIFSASQRTLSHQIANGVWQVTATLGEVGGSHQNVRVFAEGSLLNDTNAADVDTADGQFTDVVGLVQVTDGVLDLTFDQWSSEDREWALSRLSLTQVGDANFILFDPDETSFDYDLGTATSPLASGFDRVSDLTNGDAFWSVPVQSADRTTGSDLERDFVFGTDAATFEHELASGVWDVTVLVGDELGARDNISIGAEGLVQLPDIDTAAGEFVEHTFRVEVSDGGLSLQIQDNGGDPFWVLNQLSFTRVNGVPITEGDFNADQQVDDADLQLWESEFGTIGIADANLDRQVNGFDFLAWQRNFGVGVPSVTTLIDATTRNGSFEDHTGSTGLAADPSIQQAFSTGGTPATIPSWTLNATTGIGSWEAAAPNVASDGTAYASAGNASEIVLTSELLSNFVAATGDEFTLQFDAGSSNGTAHIYEARLIFGGTTRVIGSVVDSTQVSGSPTESLFTHTLNYTAVAGDAGFSPVLELVVENQGGLSLSYLDNIVLIGSRTGPQPQQALASAVASEGEAEEEAAPLAAASSEAPDTSLSSFNTTGLIGLPQTSQSRSTATDGESQEIALPLVANQVSVAGVLEVSAETSSDSTLATRDSDTDYFAEDELELESIDLAFELL